MPFDYSDASPPQFDLIPDGTIATVCAHIRAGNVGEDNMLKRSKDGTCEMLDLEFVVIDGEFKGRKFWQNLLFTGTSDGQKKAALMSLGTLKAMLDSALGLDPKDVSPEARAARTVSVKKFDGMCCIAKIGTEVGGPKPDGSGNYQDKNVLAGIITKDKKQWHPVEQPWWQRPHRDVCRGSGRAAGLGTVMSKLRRIGEVSLSAIEDQWQRDATAAAITAARGVVQMDGPIPFGTLIRTTAQVPPPWDAGAVATILPDLFNACPELDWSKPLAGWKREEITEFLLKATSLVRKAILARDLSEKGITRKSSAATIARQANAAAGGPLMTPDEFNDEIEIC